MFSEKIASLIEASNPSHGFSIFTTEDRKQSFYYFANEEGSVQLLSRAYTRSRSAERALHNLIGKAASIKLEKQGKKCLVVILNGNQQPVAQSQLMTSEKRAKALIKDMKGSLEPPKPGEAQTANKETSTTPTSSSFRHSFRLDFYPEDEHSTLRGKIEHLLSRETKTFQGLDTRSIEAFIKKFTDTRPKKRTTLKKINTSAPVKLELWKANQPTGNFNFPIGSKLEVAVHLRDKIKEALDAEIYLKSMETDKHIQQLIGRQTLQDQAGAGRILLSTHDMSPGFYQIIAKITPKEGSSTEPPSPEGQQIIHLY